MRDVAIRRGRRGCQTLALGSFTSRVCARGGTSMGLLSEIEAAATTSVEPLADLLRRCKGLAARLKNTELATWVSRELSGYGDDDPVPTYRIVLTPHSKGEFVGPL